MIQISDYCRTLRNYHAMFAIRNGIHSAPIHRQKIFCGNISFQDQCISAEIDRITNNFEGWKATKKLRKDAIYDSDAYCKPWIGLIIQDLVIMEDGCLNNNLYENCVKIGNKIKCFLVFQNDG